MEYIPDSALWDHSNCYERLRRTKRPTEHSNSKEEKHKDINNNSNAACAAAVRLTLYEYIQRDTYHAHSMQKENGKVNGYL